MSQGSNKRARRSGLSRLLGQLNPVAKKPQASVPRIARGSSVKLEGLEQRQLLAGDVSVTSNDQMGPIDTQTEIIASATSTTESGGLTTVTSAEGEPAPDLVAFAKALDAAGVTFFGAHWCPACTEQKQLFQDGGDDLPFIEVTNPDRSIGQIGIDNNITAYPTWVFPDDTRETGVLTLQQLSDRSGVAIPQSEDPTFDTIGDQTVLIGSPFHIPVDAYDPNGGPLTVTVSVDDPSLIEAVVLSGNRSIVVNMETYGDMVFELFEQRAPEASGRVIELASADFYDDIIFHRVINNFVIQGGDPTGTGTSGSTLGNFDDDFHPELQHNRSGVLSFAKSSDDTNNSQFFITETPTRGLDFNHSVFGQLVEGEDVRDAISNHAVNGADRPTTDVAINTIDVFTDTENSVIMLRPTGSGTGSTNVTVTVTDEDGNTHDEVFQVDVNTDFANSQPFLNETTVADSFPVDTPATVQLSSTDVEGDAVTYSTVVVSSGTGATASITQNGLLTVTPASGFTGDVDVRVTVQPGPGVTGNSASDNDNQIFRFNFENDQTLAAPTSIDLRDSSDTGSSNSDNITNAGTLAFTVEGVTSGATVQLINSQTSAVLGEAVATGTSVTVTTNNIATLGDGTYNVTARQVLGGDFSEQTSAVSVTYDTTAPASVANSANRSGNVGRLYQSDLISTEEGSIAYALTQGPSGASINTGSGLIEWTPDAGEEGDNSFTVTTTDLAGNVQTDNFTVDVAAAPVADVKLVIRDTNGNEISSVNVGDEFTLELVGVDSRNGFDRSGVYAIYADILFDSSIVQIKSGSTIEHVGDFTLVPKGTLSSGLIDEIGGASNRASASNEDESVIARVEMVAVASGSVNIRSESADDSGSEVLLFGLDDEIPADSVSYGNFNLTVGLDFTLVDDTATVAEDSGSTVIDVLGNDTTNGSSNLSVVSVDQPTSGGVVTVTSGVVAFTPTADFNGTSVFTYRAGDGSGAQDVATVTVTVTAVNDPPNGVNDTFEVIEGTSANRLEVLANDSTAPDSGETLTVSGATTTTSGATVTVSTDGQAVNYTPASGFTGTDTFTYTVSDGQATDTVSVTVTVTSADPPPTAVNDSFAINEDTAEASYDILSNDTRDVDNQAFVITALGTPNQGGSVRFSSDGSTFFYAPAPDFFGIEVVSYTIRDTGGGVSTGQITFTVSDVEDPPPSLDDTIQVSRGAGETIVLRISDLPENVDGTSETLSFVVTTAQGTTSQGGTVDIDSSGNLTYEASSTTFTGTDTLTYSVSDGTGTNSTGTLTIEVIDLTERNITVNFSGNQGRRIATAVRLTGTDALGNSVSESPLLGQNNELQFNNLLPGDYVVEIPALPFFTGAETAQQYSVNSAPDDGDATVDATMGRLKPEFLTIQDWLGSTPAQSVMVVVEPGEPALLTEASSLASESITDPEVALNDAGTQLTVTGNDSDSAAVTASALTSNGDVVQPRGQIGDLRLYRVNVSEAALTYSAQDNSGSGAEGEQTDGLTAEGTGEAESTTTPETSPAAASDSASQQIVGNDSGSGGLMAAGTAEGEQVSSAISQTQVSAPLMQRELVDRAIQSGDEADNTVADAAPTSTNSAVATLSRRRFTPATPASTTGTTEGDVAEGLAEGLNETTESSRLSASRVDRFFRRGR